MKTISPFRVAGSLLILSLLLVTNARAGLRRDYGIYPVPSPPPLPAAGGTVIDPTFNTTVMRLTDENDGPECINSYSYWPTFNVNSTRLLIFSGTAPLLYRFDPAAFQIIDKVTWDTPLPMGGTVRWDDAIWSGTDPDVIYAHDTIGMRIWSYNVATQTYTQIGDLSPIYNNGDYLWQMSKAIKNDNVFAFTRRDRRYRVVGYLVWQRDTNQVIYTVNTSQLDEVQVDKAGKYLVVKTGQSGAGATEVQVVDLTTFTVQNLGKLEATLIAPTARNNSIRSL